MKQQDFYFLITLIFSLNSLNATQCIWSGAVNDQWSNSGNWSCAIVPGINDTVIIGTGATVVLDVIASIKQLELNNDGQINGSANLDIQGDFVWNGDGSIGDGSGGIFTVIGKTILSGGQKDIVNKTLRIQGGGDLSSGRIDLNQSAKIEFGSDHTFTISATSFSEIRSFNNSVVINNGTIKRTTSSNYFQINTFINNDSLIVEGRLRLLNTTMNNAVVEMNGDDLHLHTSILNSTKISGGSLYHDSGLCTVNSGTTIDSRLFISGSSFLNNTSLTQNKLVRFTGAYTGGPNSVLTLNARSYMDGSSTMLGEGQVIVNDTFAISGVNANLANSISLELNDITFFSATLFRFAATSQMINRGHFLIENMDNSLFSLTNGTPRFINEGTLVKNSSHTVTIQIDFENIGQIQGVGLIDFVTGRLSGNGNLSPGLSPGMLSIDENIDLGGDLLIEINSNEGAGIGHDLLEVSGTFDITDASLNLMAVDTVATTSYTIMRCTGSANCIQGTFLSTNLAPGFSVNYLADSIVVSKSTCIDTLNITAALLASDPHSSAFTAANLINSDGVVTTPEQLVFSAPVVQLNSGFTVEVGAMLDILVVGCATAKQGALSLGSNSGDNSTHKY